jgi:beta-galactosidase
MHKKIFCRCFAVMGLLGVLFIQGISALATTFVPPASPRVEYNFNPDWKFIRQNMPDAEKAGFDDSKWMTISTPHTFNDTDSYNHIISHSGGDRDAWTGIVWYRKHFKLPARNAGDKVFLEFEGIRQAARFWVNGHFAGLYENGVTPCGLDLTRFVRFGDVDNVIAVKVNNRTNYKETATGVPFEWEGRAFNPDYGGLHSDVRLILTGKIYQTLPLYDNLKTTGIYIYPSDFDIKGKSCNINIESQVRNDSGHQQSITLSAVVVDAKGNVCARFQSETAKIAAGATETLTARSRLDDAHFWDVNNPYLYDVYCILSLPHRFRHRSAGLRPAAGSKTLSPAVFSTSNDANELRLTEPRSGKSPRGGTNLRRIGAMNGTIVDVQKITTGFRKTEFKGGVGAGGVYVNDKFVWLTGYAQRASDSWAALGEAYPDWMHDYNAELIRSTHANYIRWMHISPQAADVRACDQAGIIEVCPAGDKEGDPVLDRRLSPKVAARQWEQRVEVMRDAMVFFRNNPSILFWEAGNSVLTTNHMQQMVDLRKEWDPNGGRVIGTRDNDNAELNMAITPIAEYYGVMIGQDPRTDQVLKPGEIFRGYSIARRDRAPLIECEDFRDEAARRFWDNYSPPFFGFKPGPYDTYHWNSETFCLAAAVRYHDYMINIITNTDPLHSKWSGYASIYWSDANADGRQDSSEVCRVSGKVDAVRLPKQAYYVYRVMQNPKPDIHIIGHWTYPSNMVKTVYVAANHCDSVELFANGKPIGTADHPCDFVDTFGHRDRNLGNTGYIYAFPDVKFMPGVIRAEGKADGRIVAEDSIETAGPPRRLRLTVFTGPDGLRADGSDVAFIDFEAVDAKGERCPTDEARVNFKLTGPAIWRGGYDGGITNSVDQPYLDTECGVNRVFIRSTLTPGVITLTASRPGLEPATIKIASHPVDIKNGLEAEMPQRLSLAAADKELRKTLTH